MIKKFGISHRYECSIEPAQTISVTLELERRLITGLGLDYQYLH